MQELLKKEKIIIRGDLNEKAQKRRQVTKKVNGVWDFGIESKRFKYCKYIFF